jgi:hypothetical protein
VQEKPSDLLLTNTARLSAAKLAVPTFIVQDIYPRGNIHFFTNWTKFSNVCIYNIQTASTQVCMRQVCISVCFRLYVLEGCTNTTNSLSLSPSLSLSLSLSHTHTHTQSLIFPAFFAAIAKKAGRCYQPTFMHQPLA